MSHPDLAAVATAIAGPNPIVADVAFSPEGVQTVTINLPGVAEAGRTVVINSRPPSPEAGGDDEMSDLTNDLAGRVGRLEGSLNGISRDIGSIQSDMKHVATKSWILVGVITVLVSILGAAWLMVQQYLSPILQHLPH